MVKAFAMVLMAETVVEVAFPAQECRFVVAPLAAAAEKAFAMVEKTEPVVEVASAVALLVV